MSVVDEVVGVLLMELLTIALYSVVASFSLALAFNFYINRRFIWVKRLSYFMLAFSFKQWYLTIAMFFRYSKIGNIYAVMTHGDALIIINVIILIGLYPLTRSILWGNRE